MSSWLKNEKILMFDEIDLEADAFFKHGWNSEAGTLLRFAGTPNRGRLNLDMDRFVEWIQSMARLSITSKKLTAP